MTDLALVFLPKVHPHSPPSGVHLLKAALGKAGFRSEVYDFNLDLFLRKEFRHLFETDSETFDYSISGSQALFDQQLRNGLDKVFSEWAKILLEKNPQVIGLSLFSSFSLYPAKFLIQSIRKINKDQRIVIGGAGAYLIEENEETKKNVCPGCDILTGEAEESLVAYLHQKKVIPNASSLSTIPDSLIAGDYHNVNFEVYDKLSGAPGIDITGSRGCVRKCSFCDVSKIWPKYSFRPSQQLFDEILYYYEQHDRRVFRFTDSLINGNMKNLRDLSQKIIDYQRVFPDFKPIWGGQAICRNRKSMTPKDFDLIASAGCRWFTIGIESGSESVRDHMKKQFSNEDIEYTLKEMKRVSLKGVILMMTGYVTETEEDFNDSLKLMENFKRWGLFGSTEEEKTIRRISWGGTMQILPYTPIYDVAKNELGVDVSDRKYWVYASNNRRVRLERLFRAVEHVENLGAGDTLTNMNWAKLNQLKQEYLDLCVGEGLSPYNVHWLEGKVFKNSI